MGWERRRDRATDASTGRAHVCRVFRARRARATESRTSDVQSPPPSLKHAPSPRLNPLSAAPRLSLPHIYHQQ